MTFKPHGQHLILGQWVASKNTFISSPATGPSSQFFVAGVEDINAAVQAAEDAFWSYGYISCEKRAAFLNTIADEIEARATIITQIGCAETGLPEARLNGERGRTTGQLRLFADHILQSDYLDRRHDAALPDRQPMPRTELNMIQRPIGPVAVFGASNFPLAFSTAGGDTAAALAAGCPVVVKAHGAHPGTSEIVAEAVLAAISKCNIHVGVFSLIQGGDSREVGAQLVKHPLVKAVGFTGSHVGGVPYLISVPLDQSLSHSLVNWAPLTPCSFLMVPWLIEDQASPRDGQVHSPWGLANFVPTPVLWLCLRVVMLSSLVKLLMTL